MTYPDGRLVNYTRDALGRVSAVSTTDALGTTAVASTMAYRADGLMTGLTFGNGIAETRSYDLQGRLTQQTRGLEALTYAYDPNGNVTATTQILGPSTYAYDALDRLTDETITGVPYQASYDANGNRLSALALGHVTTLGYDPSSNRLAGLTVDGIPEAVSLDAAGNLTSLRNGQATLAYNSPHRLASVTYLGAPLAAYTYNHTGLRTRKTTPAGTLVYHYDQAGQLLMETTAQGLPLRSYIWQNQTPLAQIDLTPAGPRLIYLHTDHLNTPRAASNATGTVVWRWAGEAFGIAVVDAGSTVVNNLRFPGQYYDQETGMHYNWNRYYDPALGRYLTTDPIGLDGGINPYAYVDNNPLIFDDPLGLVNALKGGKLSKHWQNPKVKHGDPRTGKGKAARGGYIVTVSHTDGSYCMYMHMDPNTAPKPGPVSAGQYIGDYANPTNGYSTGPHVHIQCHDKNGKEIDPGDVSSVVPCPHITSPYNDPKRKKQNKGKGHRGVDVVNDPSRCKPKPNCGEPLPDLPYSPLPPDSYVYT